jgi:hypothetical protein
MRWALGLTFLHINTTAAARGAGFHGGGIVDADPKLPVQPMLRWINHHCLSFARFALLPRFTAKETNSS